MEEKQKLLAKYSECEVGVYELKMGDKEVFKSLIDEGFLTQHPKLPLVALTEKGKSEIMKFSAEA